MNGRGAVSLPPSKPTLPGAARPRRVGDAFPDGGLGKALLLKGKKRRDVGLFPRRVFRVSLGQLRRFFVTSVDVEAIAQREAAAGGDFIVSLVRVARELL